MQLNTPVIHGNHERFAKIGLQRDFVLTLRFYKYFRTAKMKEMWNENIDDIANQMQQFLRNILLNISRIYCDIYFA